MYVFFSEHKEKAPAFEKNIFKRSFFFFFELSVSEIFYMMNQLSLHFLTIVQNERFRRNNN